MKTMPSTENAPARAAAAGILLATLCVVAPAQETRVLGPRSFLPPDYSTEIFVDVAALRDLDVLELLGRGPGKLVVVELERSLGVALEAVDRIRVAGVWRDRTARASRVILIEGRGPSLPAAGEVGAVSREADVMGGYDVLVESSRWVPDRRDQRVFVSPRPGVLVVADRDQAEAVLERGRPGGAPHPELLAFTAGPPCLFYVAGGRLGLPEAEWRASMPFPRDWYVDEDGVEFAMLRAGLTAGGTVRFEMVLRFAVGEKGPERFAGELRRTLEEAAGHPRLGAFKGYLRAVRIERDGPDLIAWIDLGGVRRVVGLLATLAPLLFVARVEEVPAQAQGIVVEEAKEAKPGKEAKPRKGKQQEIPRREGSVRR